MKHFKWYRRLRGGYWVQVTLKEATMVTWVKTSEEGFNRAANVGYVREDWT